MSAPHRPNPYRDGGLAFPRPASIDPAFDARCASQTGMSMRDFYAAHALAGLSNSAGTPEAIARHAFTLADWMVDVRAEGI